MAPIILADDLSGAMETAAAFLRHGWRPAIPLDATPATSTPRASASTGTLPVVSTETRAFTPDAAFAALAKICADIRAQKRELLFKKIDSTMRGPVGAELAAVCAAFSERPVYFTPANPAVGRTVVNGTLLVNGAPVSQTAFRNDPGSPIAHDSIARLLAASGWPQNGSHANARLTICDAGTQEDLRAIVQRAFAAHVAPLFVGASALGAAVAEHVAQTAKSASVFSAPNTGRPGSLRYAGGGTLFVCGSKHPASHRQMRELGIPLRVLPVGEEAQITFARTLAADLITHGRAAAMSLDFPGAPDAALAAMENAIARTNEIAPVAALFATGGETARALCQRLGGSALELLAEIEPGVIAARMPCADGTMRLVVTKPGGYGDDQSLVRVREWFEKQ